MDVSLQLGVSFYQHQEPHAASFYQPPLCLSASFYQPQPQLPAPLTSVWESPVPADPYPHPASWPNIKEALAELESVVAEARSTPRPCVSQCLASLEPRTATLSPLPFDPHTTLPGELSVPARLWTPLPMNKPLKGEDGFKCTWCSYSSRRMADVAKHMRKHTQEKPYHCGKCQASFSSSSSLSDHMRTHTGQRPYVCEVCSKSFTARSSLHKHRNTHSGGKTYPCPHCDHVSTQGSNLKRHIRRAHNKGDPVLIKPQ